MIMPQPESQEESRPPGQQPERPIPPANREIPHDLYCQECGYNLRGLISDRCPECGHSLETVRATGSQIPWVHRKKLAWFRAYWKTVWMVMFRQRRFCEEMARPVSYRDSQSFRWLTILHAYVPIVVLTLALYLSWWLSGVHDAGPTIRVLDEMVARLGLSRIHYPGLIHEALPIVWPVVWFHVLFLLYLVALTGVPSYFFHPKDAPIPLQNRAIALSYYTCAPLALTAVPAVLLTAAFAMTKEIHIVAAYRYLAVSLVLLLIVWLLALIRVRRQVVPHHAAPAGTILVCFPLAATLLALLIFAGIPAGVLFVAVMLKTLG
jgi:hypothetical protein